MGRKEVAKIAESLKPCEQSRRAGGIKITLNGHRFGSLSCAEMLFVYFILNVFLIPCYIKVNSTIYFFLSSQVMRSFCVVLLPQNSSHNIFNAHDSSLGKWTQHYSSLTRLLENGCTVIENACTGLQLLTQAEQHRAGALRERLCAGMDTQACGCLPSPDPSLHLLPSLLSHRHTQREPVSELNSE